MSKQLIGVCRLCEAETGVAVAQYICDEKEMLCCRHKMEMIRNRRINDKTREKHTKQVRSFGYTGELEMFKDIWMNRPHVSQLSGRPISFFSVANFAHILSKKKYPYFRLNPDNIILLTMDEHSLFDNGTITRREEYKRKYPATKWDMLFQLVEVMKEEYNEHINNLGT